MPFLDLIKCIDDLKAYRKTFILSPPQWDGFMIEGLDWKNVKFSAENKAQIPEVRGVYCFIIKFVHEAIPSNGHIAYVGLVADKNDRTLRIRYADYLRDQRRPKRVHIYELLNRWKDNIYFYYAEVPDRQVSLSTIETALLDAIVPPYNRKDFSGKFGAIVMEAFR